MSENNIKLINEDGKIVGKDPETGDTIPIEFENIGLEDLEAESVSTDEASIGSDDGADDLIISNGTYEYVFGADGTFEADGVTARESSSVAYLSDDIEIGDFTDPGTASAIPFDATLTDHLNYDDGDHNISVPSDGLYSIAGQLAARDSFDDTCEARICINGSEVAIFRSDTLNEFETVSSATVDVDLDEGDEIDLRLWRNELSGDTRIRGESGEAVTFLRVRRV